MKSGAKEKFNKAEKMMFFSLVVFALSNGAAQQNIVSKNIRTENVESKISSPLQCTSLRGNGMMFTQNKGQIVDMAQHLRPDILFKGDGGGADIYLRKSGLIYVLSNTAEVMHEIEEKVEDMIKAGEITHEQEQEKKSELEQKALLKIHRIDVDFYGGNTEAEIITADQVEGYNNYYFGHCRQGVIHVNSFNEVTQRNIYPGIDVKYYGGKEKGLKYDIVINPGADPSQIKLKYVGANRLTINNGQLKIITSVGVLGEYMPKVYQNINGKIVDVKAEYRIEHLANNDAIIYFSFSKFNSSFPLVIDPWVTYFGGNGMEGETHSITVDPVGNAVFTGTTQSANLPVTPGAFITTYAAGTYYYYAKLNKANSSRIYVTYLYAGGTDVVCDALGNTYILGQHSSSSTSSPAPFASAGNVIQQPVFGGGGLDIRLLKFNSAGALLWDTFYGGVGDETGLSMATDGSNVYITGTTNSVNNIATAGTYKSLLSAGSSDAFVAKFQSNGARVWGTYTDGGPGVHQTSILPGHYIACDRSSGDVYITGSRPGTGFVATAGAHQMGSGGGSESCLFKINPITGTRVWATFYGGAQADVARGITVDNAGNVIIVGETSSIMGIGTLGTQQPLISSTGGLLVPDGFIAKFNSNGNKLWGTYLGGNQQEIPVTVDVDAENNIYVWGEFEDACAGDYPISSCAYQPTCGGDEEPFIARYSPNGMQLCITYFGGGGQDEACEGGGDIVVYQNILYVCGATNGFGFPVTAGASQTVYGGPTIANDPTIMTGGDAFIGQLCINLCESKVLGINFTASTTASCANNSVTFNPAVSNSCDTTGYKFLWTFSGGTPATSMLINPSVAFAGTGNHDVKLKVITACKSDSITKSSFITITPCTIAATTVGASVCSGSCATITANVTTGTAPFTYIWSTGSTSQSISACPSSSAFYTATIKDNTGANTIVTAPVTVSNININITSTAASCVINNGTATANITNGIAPYTYLWSNGQVSKTATGLGPGTFTVTVTDAKGCAKTTTVTTVPISIASSSQNINCTTTGQASVAVLDGSPPFSYAWSTGQTGMSTVLFSTAGIYTVTVTDANGCSITRTFNITGASPSNATFTQSPSGTICIGNTVVFTNTKPADVYIWTIIPTNPSVSGSTNNFSYKFLSAGTYTISLEVRNGGCMNTAISVVNVINCASPTITTTGSTVCPGGCATVTSSPAGGTIPYTYFWSTGSTSQNINPCPVSTTTYSVTIKDSGGNTATSTAIVTVNPAVNATITTTNITCTGGTGSAFAVVGSGTSPYIYNWSNGSSGSTVSGLTAGNYNVTVTDSKGCTSISTTTVISPPALVGQFTKGGANCLGCGCKEWVLVTAIGGTSPYSYTWPDGYLKRYKNHLCPGTYLINIKDKNGCSVNVNLTAP